MSRRGKEYLIGYGFDREKFARMLNVAIGASTYKDFAAKCGISPSYFSKYLNGRMEKPPTMPTLKKIAACAENQVSFGDLAEAAGYMDNAGSASSNPAGENAGLVKGIIISRLFDCGFSICRLQGPDSGFDISAVVRNCVSGHEVKWFFYICRYDSEGQLMDSLYDCYGRVAGMKCDLGPGIKVSLVVSDQQAFEEAGKRSPHGLPIQASVILADNGKVNEKHLKTALDFDEDMASEFTIR